MTLTGWVPLNLHGQLDMIGAANDTDEHGAYPLTISIRRDAIPDLLLTLTKATTKAAAEEERPAGHTQAIATLADQLARTYDWRRIDELVTEDPDAAARHREAAEELWPWLNDGPKRALHDKWTAGWNKGRENGYNRAIQEHAHDAEHLALATELRIPCPAPADTGHTDLLSRRRPDDLILRKNTTGAPKGWEGGWLILNPNVQPGDHVWTGKAWVYRGDLPMNGIYKWTLGEAVKLARQLAAGVTIVWDVEIADLRARRAKEQA